MKLLRVQVPDFRVLKNVDISFEKDFVPSIFPLGSQNGGGKSTLLQLIFILLHCSGDSKRHEFIKNILYGFGIDDNSHKRVVAIIDIWDGEKTVSLDFSVFNNSGAAPLLASSKELSDFHNVSLSEYMIFSAPSRLKYINQKIEVLTTQISDGSPLIKELQDVKSIEDTEGREARLKSIELNFRKLSIFQFIQRNNFRERMTIEVMEDAILQRIAELQSELKKLKEEREKLEYTSPKILNFLHSNQIAYICNYSTPKDEDKVLLCHVNHLEIDQTENFFKKLSSKMFLAAPTTQVFLFLSQNAIKMLFQQHKNNYQSQITNAKSKLPGLFPYDFFAVNLLINIFKNARDKDFKEAIDTGEYGDSYKQLINDLNLILLNKKINITTDLSGFTFKLNTENQDTELSPADLSHGELKRLSIYAWLKYNVIDDAIVLMDEIENGFHPDWQYQIINDINEWSPNNQYIIATHSYELCQAVTPAHVKELDPRLIKQESES